MASDNRSITEFPNGTLTEGSLFVAADVDAGTGYASGKHSASGLANGMCGEFEFAALETGDKTIFGSINELNAIGDYATASGTLTAGQTSLTISDNRITTDSLLDIYTSIYGVSPTAVTVSAGSAVLTFEAQASNMDVAINIKGEHGGSSGATTIVSEYKRVDTNGVNTVPKTLYTFNATEKCLLSWSGTCVTDTGSNEGLLYCTKNGVQQGERVNLIRGTETSFDFDLSLNNGDSAEIVASWTGSHSNCYFYLRLGEAVAK